MTYQQTTIQSQFRFFGYDREDLCSGVTVNAASIEHITAIITHAGVMRGMAGGEVDYDAEHVVAEWVLESTWERRSVDHEPLEDFNPEADIEFLCDQFEADWPFCPVRAREIALMLDRLLMPAPVHPGRVAANRIAAKG